MPSGGGSGGGAAGSGIAVWGGGDTVVASDALLAQLDALSSVGAQLRREADQVVGLLYLTAGRAFGADIPQHAIDAGRSMNAALRLLTAAEQRATDIHRGVRECLEVYTRAEQVAGIVLHGVGEQVAWGLGVGARIFGLPVLLDVAGATFTLCWITGRRPADVAAGLQEFLRAHGRILTNPVTVAAIREAAADADGFGDGFLGMPPGLARATEAGGLTNASTSSAGVVALGGLAGLFRETGVSVTKTSSFEYGTPPTSLVDRANSFPYPKGDPNGEQIRIDRYVEPGKPDRFDVFIAGTVTFDPKATTEPFDLTSDLTGVAQESPASYRAVLQAMKAAGVTSTSPVVLNGYSQGGLIASLVAASGKYNVKGVVTFGAPSGPVQIPANVPVLTVRNTEDLVPATSGYDVNPNAVVVQRALFADRPVPTDWAVPAHELSYYQETAAVVDGAKSSQVRSILDPLNSFGAGATRVDSTLWVATRGPDPVTPSDANSTAQGVVAK